MPTEGRRCGRDNTSETRRVALGRQDSCRPRGKNHPVRRESLFDPGAWAEGAFKGPLRARSVVTWIPASPCQATLGACCSVLPLSRAHPPLERAGCLSNAPGPFGERFAARTTFLRWFRPASLLQALLEGVHQIDHLPTRGRRTRTTLSFPRIMKRATPTCSAFSRARARSW